MASRPPQSKARHHMEGAPKALGEGARAGAQSLPRIALACRRGADRLGFAHCRRHKLGRPNYQLFPPQERSLAILRFGDEVAEILRRLPTTGPLFPNRSKVNSQDRAARFNKRCKALGISDVSLHSYRYSWAERARAAGYPERYAQEALGHKSAAIHRAYAKKARVELPPLEEYARAFSEILWPLNITYSLTGPVFLAEQRPIKASVDVAGQGVDVFNRSRRVGDTEDPPPVD
jgi:hypothetical protein